MALSDCVLLWTPSIAQFIPYNLAPDCILLVVLSLQPDVHSCPEKWSLLSLCLPSALPFGGHREPHKVLSYNNSCYLAHFISWKLQLKFYTQAEFLILKFRVWQVVVWYLYFIRQASHRQSDVCFSAVTNGLHPSWSSGKHSPGL